MSYLDSGFDIYLDKTIESSTNSLTEIDQDALFDSISGDKIQDGSLNSTDGNTSLNLAGAVFRVSDGLVTRVEMGKFEDGEYGLRVRDQDNNLLINITGKTNLIQSASGKMQLDLTEEQARWYDELNLRILLGKGTGLY